MIYMLSKFDLSPDVDFKAFQKDYSEFVQDMRSMDLAVSTGNVGTRIADTPMDTDLDDAPRFYVIMTFRDRDQLDKAYRYIATGQAKPEHLKSHQRVHNAILNPVFTCWQDET
ncbi:MAG: hypothetical protein AAGA53_03720 [Pseudomonadota bacterium]